MPSKPLTVVFCLPGSNFSGAFLRCWSELLQFCFTGGIRVILSQQSSCNIYYVRNMCLGGDVLRGPKQKPFNGQLDYDYLMWIDSDSIFTPQQFQKLLEHDMSIVSGVYMMADNHHFATVKDWDEGYFSKHGSFQFLTPDDIKDKQEPFEVAYTGMGFMLVKLGVFESLEYPWFRPLEKRIGDAVDFTMEDVAFCLGAGGRGTHVVVDPTVRVGHEKRVTL